MTGVQTCALPICHEIFGQIRVGHREERLEELVDTLAGGRGDVDDDGVAAPLLGNELVLGELLTDPRGIGEPVPVK